MTDHDQQLRRIGHLKYGEAALSAHQPGIAVKPRLFGFAEGQFCLCGQYFSSFPFWRRRERHRQKGSLECVVTRALATAAPTPWKNAAMS